MRKRSKRAMKNITVLLVLAVGISLLAYYMLFRIDPDISSQYQAGNASSEEVEQVDEESSFKPLSGVGSLESLRLLGKDIECTIAYADESTGTAIEGTYFVSGEEMRADMLVPSPDLQGMILSSMIVIDGMLYSWAEIDGEKYGMKMTLADFDTDETSDGAPVSLTDDLEYDCKQWENVDRTVFVPPSDVRFQDQSALMRAGMEEAIIYEETPVPEM